MAHLFSLPHQVYIEPTVQREGKLAVTTGPKALALAGFNIPVIITGIQLKKNSPQSKSKIVMAHFDTGATVTTIAENLAQELGLLPIGEAVVQTAGGPKNAKRYIVDISFPNTQLKGYRLSVNDCILRYDAKATELTPKNFGVLIGRDIMSKWNIVWNGPNSTVIISD